MVAGGRGKHRAENRGSKLCQRSRQITAAGTMERCDVERMDQRAETGDGAKWQGIVHAVAPCPYRHGTRAGTENAPAADRQGARGRTAGGESGVRESFL